MSQNNPPRFEQEDVAAMRRGISSEHGRYMALMDLSHLLSSDNMEALLPAAEVVLNRPGAVNPSMVDLPSTSRLDMEDLTPPPPPLPLPKIMVKNLLKDRRRIALNFPPSATLPPIFQEEAAKPVDKSAENFLLKKLFKKEEKAMKKQTECMDFATDLLYNVLAMDTVTKK